MVNWQKILPRLVALIAVVGFIIYHGYYQAVRLGQTGLIDLTVFYVAGQAVTGENSLVPAQLYDQAKIRPVIQKLVPVAGTHFLYLPPAAVLFVPLTLWPLSTMAKIWLGLNVLLVLVCYYLSIYYLIPDHRIWRYRYSLGLVVLTFSSTIQSLIKTGQINAWLWLLFIFGVIGLVYKKPVLTGLSLGIATIFKIFPIIFLPYLVLKKNYKAALYFLITDLGLIVLSLPWFTVHNWRWFLTERLPALILGNIGSITTSVSLYGSLRWLIRYYAWDLGLQPKVVVTWLYYPYLIVTILALGSLACLLWRQQQQQKWLIEYFLIVLAVLVFAKMVQAQYLLWLVPYLLWLSKKLFWPIILGLTVLTQYTQPVMTTFGLIMLFSITVWLYCRVDKESV